MSSGYHCPFVPKPPPTSAGAMTRTCSSGSPTCWAMKRRCRCTIWMAAHTVSCPSAKRATSPRVSSGCAPPRDWRSVTRTTTSAPRIAASGSPTRCRHSAATLLASASCTSAAPGSAAASTSATAGSGS